MAGPKVHIYDTGTSSYREASNIYIYDAGTTSWRQVNRAWIYDAATTSWRLTYERIQDYFITSSTANFNLRTFMLNQGWNGIDPVSINITINPGVDIFSTNSNPNVAAFDTGTFPTGSNIILTNNGRIIGRGGDGGRGTAFPRTSDRPGNGNTGGTALRARVPITVNNNNIIAGGGGGGGGAGNTGCGQCFDDPGGSGGGGAGRVPGTGGSVRANGINFSGTWIGQSGTTTSGGSGGFPSPWGSGEWASGYNGGAGGNLGQNGSPSQINQASGGLAGFYIRGNSNVTWASTGIRLGRVG